jgi:hypothetical protein
MQSAYFTHSAVQVRHSGQCQWDNTNRHCTTDTKTANRTEQNRTKQTVLVKRRGRTTYQSKPLTGTLGNRDKRVSWQNRHTPRNVGLCLCIHYTLWTHTHKYGHVTLTVLLLQRQRWRFAIRTVAAAMLNALWLMHAATLNAMFSTDLICWRNIVVCGQLSVSPVFGPCFFWQRRWDIWHSLCNWGDAPGHITTDILFCVVGGGHQTTGLCGGVLHLPRFVAAWFGAHVWQRTLLWGAGTDLLRWCVTVAWAAQRMHGHKSWFCVWRRECAKRCVKPCNKLNKVFTSM